MVPTSFSFAILIVALVLMLVSSFTGSWVLNFLSLAVYYLASFPDVFQKFGKAVCGESKVPENARRRKDEALAGIRPG